MPRKLSEWQKIRDSYYKATAASFPYPGADSVVYQRASNNPFWERRRANAMSQINGSSLGFTVEDTFDFIGNVAAQERTKEEAFLEKFFPQGEARTGTITDQFNVLFQSRERYERLLERIRNTQKKAREDKSFGGMAPNMDALYGSYLNKRLTKMVQDFRPKVDINTDFNGIIEQFRALVDAAIIQAVNDVAAVEKEDAIYGSGKDWTEIANMISNDQFLQKQFASNIRNSIGGENLDNILRDILDQKQKGVKKQKTTTIIRNNTKLSARTAQVGGNVIENTMPILAQALSQIRGSNGNISYAMSGGAIHGQMAVTDATMIFSGSIDVDTSAVQAALDRELSSNTGTLQTAYNKIENFLKEWEKNMNELYAVYVNSKNYQLGGSHGVYDQHYDGSLEELGDFLSRAGVGTVSDDFLHTAYNTGTGAIFAGMRGQIESDVVNALKAAAAKFMFDDWQTLGTSNDNSIHMFLLGGKYVPSSVIFEAMSSAGKMNIKTEASVTLPNKVNDPGPGGWDGGNDESTKNAIYQHWKEEYANAVATSKWTADFIFNVKQAINL